MNDLIPLSVPSIKGNEWNYVKECLDTEWVSSAGKYVDHFENKIASYTGAKYAVACVNGTSALHTSLLIAGVQPKDEVIVPTITFIAPINAVRYCGATPVFMDSDKYYNIDSDKFVDFIYKETKCVKSSNGEIWETYNKKTGKRITAVIPVHIFGNAVWMDDIYSVCKERNIKIIEDASESLGSIYTSGKFKGRHTGTIGDIGCLSFNGNKIITTGGGGMILTNNETYFKKAKYLTTQAKDDEIRYIHNEIGYNYRLTNIQAALGVAQMEQLQDFLVSKRKNYLLYKTNLDKIEGVKIADTPEYAENNNWMYALQIDRDKYGKDREELMRFLDASNIQTRPVWYLNHLQKEFVSCQSFCIENAGYLYDCTLNLPCSVSLSATDINRVIDGIIKGCK